MTTRSVKFEFRCLTDTGYKNLNFSRDMPASLVTTKPAPDHTQVLHAAMVPILQEHDFACRNACSKMCNICGEPAKDIVSLDFTHNSTLSSKAPRENKWCLPSCAYL